MTSVDTMLLRERRGLCGSCRSGVRHQDRCPKGSYGIISLMSNDGKVRDVLESGPSFASGHRSRWL